MSQQMASYPVGPYQHDSPQTIKSCRTDIICHQVTIASYTLGHSLNRGLHIMSTNHLRGRVTPIWANFYLVRQHAD